MVVQLAAQQHAQGARVSVLTYESAELSRHWQGWCAAVSEASGLELRRLPAGSFREAAVLSREYASHDVLHIHKVWGRLPWHAMQLAGKDGAAVIVAPHGALSSWCLNHKRFKKQLALALTWRRTLRRVDALHALNEAEGQEIAREVTGARIAVLPNAVDLERVTTPLSDPDALLAPVTAGRPFVLFLARLHSVKGPDRLLQAFAIAARAPAFADVDLVMAGPDYGMLSALRRQVAHLGVEPRVRFLGEVRGELKLALLRRALCMCQPSRYEGFSVALLEALACSLPVVITPESNFPEIATCGAGLVVGPDPEQLAEALQRMALEPAIRATMGAAGAQLVRRAFTWPGVAQRSLKLYGELCAMSSGPPMPVEGSG